MKRLSDDGRNRIWHSAEQAIVKAMAAARRRDGAACRRELSNAIDEVDTLLEDAALPDNILTFPQSADRAYVGNNPRRLQ
jgi:hypothetical protein